MTLSRKDTRGTTMDREMRERLQSPVRGDLEHRRQSWCEKCGRWMDRDLIAVLNISRRGRVRFARSLKEGEASEPVKGERGTRRGAANPRNGCLEDASRKRDAVELQFRWTGRGHREIPGNRY